MRAERRAGGGLTLLLLLLLLLCRGMSLRALESIPQSGGVTLYLAQGAGSYADLLAAERRVAQPEAFALWGQQEGQMLKSKELGRVERVTLTTIYGDSTLPLPTLPMLLPDSRGGILLDSGTSYALFGDHSPVGAVVTLEGRDYSIVGVFPSPVSMAVRQGGAADGDVVCDRVTLGLPGRASPTEAAQEFAQRHGLTAVAVLGESFWAGTAGFFVRLPPLLILAALLYQMLRMVWSRRETPVLATLLLAGGLVGAAVFWQAFGLSFTIPTELVPSRWSDFEFWTQAIQEAKTQLWTVLTLPKELPQAIPMAAAMRCALWGTAGAAFAVPLLRRIFPRTARDPARVFPL